MPKPVDSNPSVVEKAYHRREGNHEVIGRYFYAKVRRPFDCPEYRLPCREIRLRFWHWDCDRQVILMPDRDAFDSTRFGEVFGLDQDLVPDGWN